MTKRLSEQRVEQAALGWLESLGYDVRRGADVSPGGEEPLRGSYEEVVLVPRLRAALKAINGQLPEEAIEEVVRVVTRPPEPTLVRNNRWFHGLLCGGIEVEYRTAEGEIRGDRAWLVDFERVENNDFLVVNQFTVKREGELATKREEGEGLATKNAENTKKEEEEEEEERGTTESTEDTEGKEEKEEGREEGGKEKGEEEERTGGGVKRGDLVLFLNGLPVGVVELKDPTDEGADLWKAYRQLQDYKRAVPGLFVYNEILGISDGDSTRVGSLTAGTDRFGPWRSMEDCRRPGPPELETLIRGLFAPERLVDYIGRCVTFEEDERTGEIKKRIAAYHQFRAVRNARASVMGALKPEGDGRGGVVWHTQGSGKSLTMLMLAGALIGEAKLANPTVVVVTDRNDLDGQLFGTFAAGRALLAQKPEQAESQKDLARLLNRAAGGVVFTTIQKFEERVSERGGGKAISERANIVVMADEAHRSQYGLLDGGARWMREAIPNATFVGFTGTPLELDDRSTQAVFGDYADVYDIRQAIADEATVPIYYEMQLVKLLPDEAGIDEAERLLAAAEEADKAGREVERNIEVPLAELVGADARLEVTAREIVEHFEKRREAIEGKGMVVCMSRPICMDLYDKITALKPEWHAEEDDAGFVKVVMTGSAGEGERVAGHARTKGRREALARRFKKPEDDLRLVIVCDMWLTGFDCPPLHTMYLDKPLAGHNLMQAIARVNRVFGEKPGGVVVDFLGIADQLRDAVQTYTQAGGEGSPVEEIQTQAVPVMAAQHEAAVDFFEGFDYGGFIGGNDGEQLRAVTRRFMNLVATLSKAFALAVPREETERVRDDLVYFQAVRAAIRKRLAGEGGPPMPDSRAAVRQVLSGAIASDGVIDLFAAAGLEEPNVGILSEDFLEKLAALPHRNLALETLRKLLNDQIRSRERVNIVQSRGFRESLEATLTRYTNRAITTAQVIEELIGLAREIREAVRRGEEWPVKNL